MRLAAGFLERVKRLAANAMRPAYGTRIDSKANCAFWANTVRLVREGVPANRLFRARGLLAAAILLRNLNKIAMSSGLFAGA